MRRLIAVLTAATAVAAILAAGPSASASSEFPDVIALPDGFAPEGIAVGRGSSFYVGSLADGSVYRGDLRTGEGDVIVTPEGLRLIVMN